MLVAAAGVRCVFSRNSWSSKETTQVGRMEPSLSEGLQGDFEASMAAEDLEVAKREPKSKKRKKVSGVMRYFEEMAEESEDSSLPSENAESFGTGKRLSTVTARNAKKKKKQVVEAEDVEFVAELARQDERRARERAFGLSGQEDDVGGVVQSLVSRYARRRSLGGGVVEEPSRSGVGVGLRQADAPSLMDPRLWLSWTKVSREVEVVLSVFNKCVATARSGRDVSICGAIWTGLRNHVYVEARCEGGARGALEGLRSVRQGWLKMVPVGEMMAVVSAESSSGSRRRRTSRRGVGEWVRYARGDAKYKGDLARIVAVGDESYVLQLVPRPDSWTSGQPRPSRRLFSAVEAVGAGATVEQRRFRFANAAGGASRQWELADEYFDVMDNEWYRGGYLFKEVKESALASDGAAAPTLDEIEQFVVEDGEAADDGLRRRLEQGLQHGTGAASELSVARGDQVEATNGDLVGLPLVVERVDQASGDKPIVWCRHVMPGSAKQVCVPVEAELLVKRVSVGARVKLVDGRYAGQTGVVLETGDLRGDRVAVVLADSGNSRELTVRTAHCRETTEVGRGLDALQGYEVHDLVQLSAGAVALVVTVGAQDLGLLDVAGELRHGVRPVDILRKLNAESKRNVALDARDEHVRERDVVVLLEAARRPSDAPQIDAEPATVLRGYRASLWVQVNAKLETCSRQGGRVLVVKARHTQLSGARLGAFGLAEAYMGLGRRRNVSEDAFKRAEVDANTGVTGAAPQRSSRNAVALLGSRRTRDPLVGRMVRVCKGNYKGLAGMVKNATVTHVTVELHTRNKLVTESRDSVKLVQGSAGGVVSTNSVVSTRTAAQDCSLITTPYLTQATPLLGAPTPQYGANTPGRVVGTPAHTPNHTPAASTSYREQVHDVWLPRMPPKQTDVKDYGLDEEDNEESKSITTAQAAALHRLTQPQAAYPNTDEVLDGKRDGCIGEAWCMPGVEASLEGQACRLEHISPPTATVKILGTNILKSCSLDQLKRISPKVNDLIRVNDAGAHYDARLLEIEDTDGIIKLDTGEYKIIDFSAIAKIAPSTDA